MANNDSTLDILIRAQAQTQAAFEAARKDLAGLKDEGKKTNDMLGLLKGGLGAVGIAFSATAVIGFAKDILDTAGNVSDLAAALGISTDAVQDFKSSAEDSGATIDNVAQAIQKLNDEAASNAVGFTRLGLSLDKIEKMSPEDRFRAVANALKDITDPAERAARGHDLLGKSYDALAASIDNGIGSMSDSNKMSKETIDTLDGLGDSIGHVLTAAKNFGGTVISTALQDFSHMVTETGKGMHALFETLHLDTAGLKKDVGDLIDRFKILRDGVHNLPTAPKAPDLFKGESSPVPKRLNKEEEDQIIEALNKERKALDEAAKATTKLFEAYSGKAAIDEAKAAIDAVNQSIAAGVPVQKMTVEQQVDINRKLENAIKTYEALGRAAPATLKKIYEETSRLSTLEEQNKNDLDDWAETIKRHQEEQKQGEQETMDALERIDRERLDAAKADADDWNEVVRHHLEEQKAGEDATLDALKKRAAASRAALGDLAQALSQLAQVSGSTFGGMVSNLAQVVTAANAAQKAIDLMRHAGDKDANGKGKGLEGLLEMSSGILGIVSAAVAAGKAIASLFSLFDRNKGRDLVVDFAETFGGFDELHKQLAALGDEGEQLWIKLTQGVGRNNPQQAQEAIDEITAALEKQKKKQGDVQGQTEESAQATIETATQASAALDTVTEKLGTNQQAWHEWSTSVTGDIAAVAASLRGLVVPSPAAATPTPGFAGGTHGAYVDFGVGTPVMLHGRERVVTEREGRAAAAEGGGPIIIQVDGHEIARVSARYQRQVLSPYGVR